MSQLLRSTHVVFWLLIPDLHVDDIRALMQLVLESLASCIPALQKLLNSQPASSKQLSANAGNMPCGHCVLCMDCAEVWRARHGVRCSSVQLAQVEMTFAGQTCCICFVLATANDISGVEDIANEILCV